MVIRKERKKRENETRSVSAKKVKKHSYERPGRLDLN
jgi:hypothetical protein